MNPNLIKSIIRTITPYLESSIVAAVAHFGFHSTPTTVAGIVAVGGSILSVLFHALESRFKWVGVFLGWIGAPQYAPSAKTVLAQTVATLQAELEALKGPSASPVVQDLTPTISGTATGTVTNNGGTVTVTA